MRCSYPFIFEKTGPYNVHNLALNTEYHGIDSYWLKFCFGENEESFCLWRTFANAWDNPWITSQTPCQCPSMLKQPPEKLGKSSQKKKKSLWNWPLASISKLRSYQTACIGQVISWFGFSVNTMTVGISLETRKTPRCIHSLLVIICIKGKTDFRGFKHHFCVVYGVHAGMQRWTLKMDVKDAFVHEWRSLLLI